MLFRTFHSQKERREFGGSYFIEIQYCRLPPNAKIEELLSGEHEMELWKNDSLYIYGDDDNVFFSNYEKVFSHGMYGNGKTGVVDLCGINYYSVEETQNILQKLQKEHLPDQEKLMCWLEKVKQYSGFYILGL